MDETDAPRAPFEIPTGYKLAASPPTAEQLTFKHQSAAQLVGKHILFNWAAAGWCFGEITRANTDGRRVVAQGVPANFFVFYEIDDDESKHALSLRDYGHNGSQGEVLNVELFNVRTGF